jgi:hypothetical protein
LTCFPHVASASAEGADADKRVLGEFDESEEEPMLTSEYLDSLMKEPDLSEEEPISSRFSLCARHTSEVLESGHPRADAAAHASL